jgi:hypothetical protein
MASPTLSKTVAGVQTVIAHFQTVAGGVANRVRFRLPQRSKILRIGGTYRLSDATDLNVMVEAGGVNLLSAVMDLIQAAPAAPVGAENPFAGLVELGTHSWKQTFVTATGESVASAKSNVVTLAAPAAPVALDRIVAGVVAFGTHSWKVTFVGPTGESVASAKSNVITLAAPVAPTVAENPINGAIALGTHSYKITFIGPAGESVASAKSAVITLAAPAAPTGALKAVPAPGNIEDGTHSYKVTFVNAGGESVASAKSNVVTVADKGVNGQIDVTNIPVGPVGTTERKLYRSAVGDAGPWLLVPTAATLQDNVTQVVLDNTADGGLGAAAPAATGGRISVTAIPAGPVGTTSREIYRTDAGDVGAWKFVGTVAGNGAAATFADNTVDGGLTSPPAATASSAIVTIPAGPAGTTARNVYRTDTGDAGAWTRVGTVAGNVTLSFVDNTADGAGGAAVPAAVAGRGTVTIAAGPTGTLSRNIYRTITGDGGNHLLAGAVAGNVTLTFADNVADAALGAIAPLIDSRMEGAYVEGSLVAAVADEVAKETEITVDVDTLTGTDVHDLDVQIDLVRID